MDITPAPNLRAVLHLRLLAVLMLGLLFPVTVFSQITLSGTSSLRGTAKIDDKFVVDGVMVVLTPMENNDSRGTPRPAWVGPDGAYRIADLSPGTYVLTAAGKPVKPKVISGVKVTQGNSNVQNVTLERAAPVANLKGALMNAQGQPLKNGKLYVYSNALPPSVCEQCALAEFSLNNSGDEESVTVARGQDYVLAVSVYDEIDKRELKLFASNVISIGVETDARVELRLGQGSQPTLTANLLKGVDSPLRKNLRSPDELANGPGPNRGPNLANSRVLAIGQNMKIKGMVTRRDAETFIVRDLNGVDTTVRLDDKTSVKTKSGFLRSRANYAQTSILRGLNVEVEGRGNASGELTANKIRFHESDLVMARAVESRVAPLEERAGDTETKLGQVEANAQRLSGQLEELAAISNAARGGAKSAQQTADAAVAGVNATNERISALDDYAPQISAAVNFKTGSATLSPEAKTSLDEIASKATMARGYVLEISGFADSVGTVSQNRALSQRRADAVIRYLVEIHNIPLRRIVTPYGYGELNPVADNTSREGRAQNRRVEIKLLVNKGLNAPTPATVKP